MEAALKRSTEKQEQIARDVVNAEQETEEEPEQEDAEALQEEPEYEKEETDILEESSEPETDEERCGNELRPAWLSRYYFRRPC